MLKPAFQEACRAACEELARDTADGGPATLVGLPWVEDGKLYNAMALLDGGRIEAVRFKVDLPNYGVFDEKRVFAPGRRRDRSSFVACASACRSARTSGVPTRSSASSKRGAKFCSCPTPRLTSATSSPSARTSRWRASSKAGCRSSISTWSAARTSSCSTAARSRSTPTAASARNCRPFARWWRARSGSGARPAGAVWRARSKRSRRGTKGTMRPASWACATMSRTTVFQAWCLAFPAASIRLCAPRWRSMRWGLSACMR